VEDGMDLTWLKWVVIVVVVGGGIWIFTSGGIGFMESKFSRPASTPEAERVNEAGLSKLGGFLLMTIRYDRAGDVFEKAVGHYPQRANVYYNYYRLVKCYEKTGRYQRAADVLGDLARLNAHALDERVPESSNLEFRRNRLIEVHELRR
jgi:tetratricopeptide (TPR) repeat protein